VAPPQRLAQGWLRGGGQPRSDSSAPRGRRAVNDRIGPRAGRAGGHWSWSSDALSRHRIGGPPPGQWRVRGNQSSTSTEAEIAGRLAQRQLEEAPPSSEEHVPTGSDGGGSGSDGHQEGSDRRRVQKRAARIRPEQ
jgi:hypothetical protein